jgi:hypothetical protein
MQLRQLGQLGVLLNLCWQGLCMSAAHRATHRFPCAFNGAPCAFNGAPCAFKAGHSQNTACQLQQPHHPTPHTTSQAHLCHPRRYWVGVFKPGNDKMYKRTDLRLVQQARPSADASDYANWFKGFALRASPGNTKTCVAAATGSAYSSYNGGGVDSDGSYSKGGQARPGWVNEECSTGQPVICRCAAGCCSRCAGGECFHGAQMSGSLR